jgi:predicted metal-dependent peptidase
VKFANTEQNEWAYTDGKVVYAGKKFESLKDAERPGVVLHELLHVALAHPARFVRMRQQEGDSFDQLLANIAADAIINASIGVITKSYASRVTLPAFGISLGKLLKDHKLPHADLPESEAVSKWSLESLYAALKAKGAKSNEKSLAFGMDVQDSNGHDHESGGADQVQSGCPSCSGKSRRSAVETADDLNKEIEGWNRKLTTVWGSIPGMKETLAGDIPKVLTPWEPVLRNFLVRSMGKPGRPNWAKPSRRWTALEGPMLREEGIRIPFEPARDYPKKSGRVAIAVDTSGSIPDEILSRFTGEVAAVMRQTGATVLLISADAKVNGVEEFRGTDGETRLRNYRYVGRGGTDFRPAIAQMAEWKPDVAIYLTDLEGDCGEQPAFPFIWTILPGYDSAEGPWGQTLHLH